MGSHPVVPYAAPHRESWHRPYRHYVIDRHCVIDRHFVKGRHFILYRHFAVLVSALLLVCMSAGAGCLAAMPATKRQLAARPPQQPVSPHPSPTPTAPPCEWPAKWQDDLRALLGPADAVAMADSEGCRLVAIHTDKRLIPASTLKLLTAAAALHYLGPDHRFATVFFRDDAGNLKVKGYGDPLLISEVVADLAQSLSEHVSDYQDLVIDDGWFAQPLYIPGRSTSLQPYDAPNGALCVNFNTVFFKHLNGEPVSAEAQTPLLPFARKKIAASGAKKGRIGLSAGASENIRYSGELLQYFLAKAGVRSSGVIRSGPVTAGDQEIYRHLSPYPLTEVVQMLMAYSNNFMANQLFVTLGITVSQPPGTLQKAQTALRRYASEVLGLQSVQLVEGSGISRANRLSADDLLRILAVFEPHYELLRHEDGEYYKTGTLDGIRTRAGYLEGRSGELYPFVVLRNTPGATTDEVMALLKRHLP